MAKEPRQRVGTCPYFTGYQNEACLQGVNYLELSGFPVRDTFWAQRLPCIEMKFRSRHGIECAKRGQPETAGKGKMSQAFTTCNVRRAFMNHKTTDKCEVCGSTNVEQESEPREKETESAEEDT
jgi:hypothetical protein